ncbi:MAPEG family protein [Thalassolituus sp. LLYu03]|uniref:MAPEG family protein n=1 Tax=Thalassolituus sp. LLYu03 TaxID=3421656 RepID=UPI003D2A2345
MLYISGIYVALTALLLLFLAYLVVRQRVRFKIGLLDGGQKKISVAMRAQANALETAVPVLLLLVVAELNGAYPIFLHVCGIGFLLSRLLHAWGFSVSQGGVHFGRYYGTLITWVVLLALIVRVLWLSVAGLLTAA